VHVHLITKKIRCGEFTEAAIQHRRRKSHSNRSAAQDGEYQS